MHTVIVLCLLLAVGAGGAVLQQEDSFKCDLCEVFFHFIQGALKGGEVAIATVISGACDAFTKGTEMDSVCKKIVEKGLEDVIGWVASGMHPAEICGKLHACS